MLAADQTPAVTATLNTTILGVPQSNASSNLTLTGLVSNASTSSLAAPPTCQNDTKYSYSSSKDYTLHCDTGTLDILNDSVSLFESEDWTVCPPICDGTAGCGGFAFGPFQVPGLFVCQLFSPGSALVASPGFVLGVQSVLGPHSTNITSSLSSTPTISPPYPANSTSHNTTSVTTLNSTIAPTGSGSAYASQCNALYSAWTSSKFAFSASVTAPLVTFTSSSAWTSFSARTTTLPCESYPRLVGTFTPITSGYSTFATSTLDWPSFTVPTPTCTINPSDCTALVSSSNSATDVYSSAYTAAETTIILAPSATAVTIQGMYSNVTTTFASTRMPTPHPITVNGSTFTGSTYTEGASTTVTQYEFNENFLDDSASNTLVWMSPQYMPTYPDTVEYPCNVSTPADPNDPTPCQIFGGQVCPSTRILGKLRC
jgi:hypothetical protein